MCPACGYPHYHCHHHWAAFGPPPWSGYPYGVSSGAPYGGPQPPPKEQRKADLEQLKAQLEAQLTEVSDRLKEL